MKIPADCPFCQKDALKPKIYEDEHCFAILAREQYTTGHTLLILTEHATDMADDISDTNLLAFITAIHKVTSHLQQTAVNDQGEHPQRVYVCVLCDGVKHLHAHLIPRYPFMTNDKELYTTLFYPRDGELVYEAIKAEELGGFWYVAEREKSWPKTEFGSKSVEARAILLEELANKLRMS
jgi:diadenosine tetraphosphate (Ap4A) HIT family hydrolase